MTQDEESKTGKTKKRKIILGSCGVILIAAVVGSFWPVTVNIPMDGPVAEWLDYGNDRGGSRYSPLTQINPENVRHLEIAWEYHTGDVSDGSGDVSSTTAFEATPILVEGMLYVPSPFNRVIALDPETGEERWTYDPEIDLTGNYANQLICRGVTYWEDSAEEPGPSSRRIFTATNDARLIALDATTGKPCEGFGASGQIDLNAGAGKQKWKGEYQVTSPPVVSGNVVIVGSAISDNSRTNAPSGVVRAFDTRTGELLWDWDLAPPGYEPADDMKSEAGYALGTPNVWGPMSIDEERDMLFVPTGNPAPDYYGGLRSKEGDEFALDYYGSSVVALRASTGEILWRFQTVHHDLWDFDVPAQPTLANVMHEGIIVPAVIQATKMGFVFTLHRETGEPLFEVEERPVPQSDVPGEKSSPTQPFPVKPPPLVRQTLSADDAWGLIWIDRNDCREKLKGLRFEGMYTPPGLNEPTLMYPGNGGGSNWGGIAVDPERQILVANTMDLPWVVSLIPADELAEARKNNPGVEIGSQTGTPFGMRREMLVSKFGLPCNPPPWGTLAAIDLVTGSILWQEPLGTVRDLAPIPLPIKYGVPNLGGPLVTASGLIFIGAAMDNYIRAFDLETGEEIWKARLPAGGQATPMTYRLTATGKQFVVIAAGGHGRADTKLGDSVVAFALPD